MHGKVLIIDPIATNRITLKVKLTSAYYDVVQAQSVKDALTTMSSGLPDIILTAATLIDGDAADLAARVRALPGGGYIPFIALDTLADADLRHALLQAGVDDVLATPVQDTLLLARIRSLVRGYSSMTEWKMQDDTSRALGMGNAHTKDGSAVLVTDNRGKAVRWVAHLRPLMSSEISIATTQSTLHPFAQLSTSAAPDAFVLIFDQGDHNDMLRVLACIRAHADTRHCAVLVLLTKPDAQIAAQVLDLGADDLMAHGFNAAELATRLQKLIARRHLAAQLRATVRTGLEAAICDPLTGLHNRRYAMPHLDQIVDTAQTSGDTFAVLLADIDHFKHINDQYGHGVGDTVLVETARRLRAGLRPGDLIARIGGEEFLIVLPGLTLPSARLAAQHLRQIVSDVPFHIYDKDLILQPTISIGLTMGGSAIKAQYHDGAASTLLLEQADKALYRAKTNGRNQVTLSRPAA